MSAHQVLIIVVIDTRILSCVADSLQNRRFASIRPTDYKDTKVSIFRSKFIGITIAQHVVVDYHWVEIKRLRGNEQYQGSSFHGFGQTNHQALCINESNARETWRVCLARGCTTKV